MSSGPEINIPIVDKHDAGLFRSLSQFMWIQGEPLLLVYEIGHEIYTTEGIDLPALERLEAAGLLSLDAAGYVKKWFGKHTRLFYFGRPTKIQFPQEASNQLDLGHVILTNREKRWLGVSAGHAIRSSTNIQSKPGSVRDWLRHRYCHRADPFEHHARHESGLL